MSAAQRYTVTDGFCAEFPRLTGYLAEARAVDHLVANRQKWPDLSELHFQVGALGHREKNALDKLLLSFPSVNMIHGIELPQKIQEKLKERREGVYVLNFLISPKGTNVSKIVRGIRLFGNLRKITLTLSTGKKIALGKYFIAKVRNLSSENVIPSFICPPIDSRHWSDASACWKEGNQWLKRIYQFSREVDFSNCSPSTISLVLSCSSHLEVLVFDLYGDTDRAICIMTTLDRMLINLPNLREIKLIGSVDENEAILGQSIIERLLQSIFDKYPSLVQITGLEGKPFLLSQDLEALVAQRQERLRAAPIERLPGGNAKTSSAYDDPNGGFLPEAALEAKLRLMGGMGNPLHIEMRPVVGSRDEARRRPDPVPADVDEHPGLFF